MFVLSRALTVLTMLSLLPSFAAAAPAAGPPAAFADPAFQRVWERTDRLVAEHSAARSWYWGPQPGTTLLEPDADAPGGRRRVQYFDKARMEINNPAGDPADPFYVTNGLLTVELMTGRLQLGNTQFEQRCPAAIPLAGDTGDSTAPTYATFGGLLAQPRTNRVGAQAIAMTDRTGQVHDVPARRAVPGVDLVYFEPQTGRNIPRVFWDFLQAGGPIYQDGRVTTGKLSDPWFYATGLPLTEAYWARVQVAGVPRDVLIQAYERRVLTYVPDYNGSAFAVQMGNVGLHYYDWRYRGAGCAGAPAPAPPPAALDLPRYAIDPTGDFTPADVAAVRTAGGQLVRVYAGWSNLDPGASPPVYNWAAYDDVFRRVSAAGLEPLALIDGCPAWACTHDTGPVDKISPQRFGQFMAAAVAHYSRPPYNVHLWELFNEPDATTGPDHQGGFGLHGAGYAALLRAAVPAMRAADPQVRILLGGMGYDWFLDQPGNPGPFNRTWLRDVVAAGGANYFDYLNFHYYPDNLGWPSIADKAAALQGVQAGLGLHKPLICTESGLTSAPAPRWEGNGWPAGSEEVQSRYLARLYADGLAAGLRSITWFRLRDQPTAGPGGEIFRQMGLIRGDGSAKQATAAYQTLVREIGPRPFLHGLDTAALGSPALTGQAFGDAGHAVWVAWSRTDQTARLVPGAGTIVRAYSMLGTAIPVSGNAVAVGPNPVYLEMVGAP